MNSVHKSFSGVEVIKGFDLSVSKGEIVGLIGPNGAGKTTLIRLINGLLKPDDGSILVKENEPIRNGESVRRMCGTLTEQSGIYDEMTGMDNLRFFAGMFQLKDQKRRIEELTAIFSLGAFLNRKVETYSTGMRKRLGLAKTMLHRPEVLLLDEPTNGLDPDSAKDVFMYLEKLNRAEQTTILICSHVLTQLEHVCSRYVFIDQGSKKAEGTLQELRETYVKRIKLNVRVAGRQDLIETEVEGYEEVPAKIERLAKDYPLQEVRIVNDDLESIYFNVGWD